MEQSSLKPRKDFPGIAEVSRVVDTSAFFVIIRSFRLNPKRVLEGPFFQQAARPLGAEISRHRRAEVLIFDIARQGVR
jgi:hypothetical protein